MTVPEAPEIIETPSHFWYGGVDLPYAQQEPAKVRRLDSGLVEVTKKFIAKDYQYSDNDSLYDLVGTHDQH